MNYKYERKIEINEWVIVMRWFYMVAVFLIGILGNSLISLFEVKFSFFSIAFLLLIFIFINSIFYRVLESIKKDESAERLKILSLCQIGIELFIFSIVTYLIGDGGMTQVFFFLPIISASIIFGIRGAVLTAVISGLLVNTFIVYEYFDMIFGFFASEDLFSSFNFFQIRYSTFELIKTITTSNFYLVIAIVSGYSTKLLYGREDRLMSLTDRLSEEKNVLLKEKENFYKDTNKIKAHDKIITSVNKQLNQKIQELEKSEKSMLRAFSDLKVARESTVKEQRKTSAIISNFVDPIIFINKRNCISLFNPAARDIFGITKDDHDKPISEKGYYSLENFKDIIDREYDVKTSKELKSGNPNEEEVVITLGKQEYTYKVISAEVTDTNNESLGMMKIFYNLTREKMIDKMKSEFISIAAHQLRTPLSAIKWVIKMVLDGDAGKLNTEQEKLLFKGYMSNERIIGLVNDMLNVSRIEEGRFGYNFKEEDFVALLNLQIDSLSGLIKKKNINLKLEIPKKVPLVFIDGSKMILVLQNLLENAVKYTPEFGTITIGLEVGKKFLKVRIKDNGVGIPENDQPKLFSKFFRAENVVRLQTEGSGLGLFIVKNIIKKHGGEINFESKEGKGTEFVFTIPFDNET